MLGACRLGCGGSGWLGTGDGAAHLRCPPRAFLSPVTLPDTFSGSCLGPSPLYPSFHPYLLTNLPTQTSTSVRRMASSVGPARCVSTPVAATSVWTRHVLPPTGRAPAPGKGGVGCGVNGADCLPGADPLAPVQPDSTSPCSIRIFPRACRVPLLLSLISPIAANAAKCSTCQQKRQML